MDHDYEQLNLESAPREEKQIKFATAEGNLMEGEDDQVLICSRSEAGSYYK